jgi:long-chain acyl-CoA synthetase
MEERVWHRHYDAGVPASIDFEDITIPGFLERSAALYPDSTALIFFNRRMSYRQLKEATARFATALSALGVTEDSKVALQMPNMPQAVIAYFAVLALGGRVVMTNPLYVEREIEHQWNDADCCAAVVADFLFDRRIKGIRDRLPVENYIITSIPEYLRFPLNLLAPLKLRRAHPPLMAKVEPDARTHLMRALIERTRPNPPKVEIMMDEIAVLQYTGGTTGVSKGAMLTHGNLSYNVQQCCGWFTELERGNEVWLANLPFFHVFGLTICMCFSVATGGAMVLMPNPRDIPGLIRNIAKHRVTVFPGVPTQFNAINNHPSSGKLDVSSVKICVSGSAPLPGDVCEEFERITGGTIIEGFGLTETSPLTHANPVLGRRKTGSVGIPVPGTDARIVSLEDEVTELPPGEKGEIVVRGPQVMKGYWNRSDATKAVIRDGWFHTGDIGVTDDDGYFYIVGRKKDMIVAGGYNVYPDEVDDILIAHPDVLEVATIGIPDVKRGETIKSFVVLREGRTITAEELIKYSREQLAAFKIPRQIEFRDALPKSAALKILRRQLREEELAKLEEEKKT